MKKLFTLSLILGLANLAPLQGQCYTYTTQATCEAAGCTWYGNYCGDAGGGGSTSGLIEIYIYDNYYYPVDQYINAGDTVKWINNGNNPHTATANDGSFDSGTLNTGQSFMHIFSTAANYSYYCTYHSSMTGTINVGSGGGGGTDYIDITYPDSTTEWDAGSTYTITWDTNLPSADFVTIDLYKGGSSIYSYGQYNYNYGYYDFYVPDTVQTNDNFQIYIYHSYSGTSGLSDYFTIEGTITLTEGIIYPATGDTIQAGTTDSIHWYLPNATTPYYVDISLDYYDETSQGWLTYGSVESNVYVWEDEWTYTWDIGDSISSDQYKIWLYSSAGNVNEYSDEFYIEGTGTTDQNIVTYPTDGDTVYQGDDVTIIWDWVEASNPWVTIMLVIDAYQSTLGTAYAADESFLWTVSDTETLANHTAEIRVYTDTGVWFTHDGYFSIMEVDEEDDYSLDFGASGSAEVSNFSITSGEITVEIFFKLHQTDGEYDWFWIGDHNTSTNLLSFGFNNSNIGFDINGVGQVNSPIVPSTNEWHHVAAVYDGNEMRIYLDGDEEQSSILGAAFNGFSNQDLEVGWSLDGLGDIIHISDTARYENTYYDSADVSWEPDVHSVLFWNCNEGSGSVLNDASGNNYTGTFMTGTPTWSSDTPSGSMGGGGGGEGGVPDYITVTSPTASSHWSTGTGESITWTSTTPSGNGYDVDIELWQNNAFYENIVDDAGSSDGGGSYWWSIPSTIPAGTNYQVKVKHADSAVEGTSSVFEISTGGSGGGGSINGAVSLSEDLSYGQVQIGAYSPGTSTTGPWDINGPNWGEDPPFSNVGFQIQSDQFTPSNGPYAVGAFFDANNNNMPDTGEPTGMVENIYTDATGNYSGVYLVLSSTGGGTDGQITGSLSFDTNVITGGDAIVGLFWPGDDETNWDDVTDMQNLGDVSSGADMAIDFTSSLIDDDSDYHIAAFVDYDGDEMPNDIEPYVTSGAISVSGGQADMGSLTIEYSDEGDLSTEASSFSMVATTGGVVEGAIGLMNDGSGPVLIDDITTDNVEFQIDDFPAGIAAGGSGSIHYSMDFSSVTSYSGGMTISVRNNTGGNILISYEIEVYDSDDATIVTDSTTVSTSGSYDLDDVNTSITFSGVTGDGGTITVTLVDGAQSGDDTTGMAARYWEVTADFDFTSADICFDLTQLEGTDILDGITDFSSLVIYSRPSYSTDDWVAYTDLSYDEDNNSICAENVTDFSGWGVGGGGNFVAEPQITADLTSLVAIAGQNLSISALVTSTEASINDVGLAYFKAGDTQFSFLSLTDADSDNNYTGDLAGSELTEKGLVGFIAVTDEYARVVSTDTVDISVSFDGIDIPNTSANTYRLISVPGILSNKTISGVLGDELGSYDNTVWRLSRWNTEQAQYAENTGQFSPASSFWIITKDAKTLAAGSGSSTPILNVPTVSLKAGWSMIATPYAVNTSLSAFEVQSGSVENTVWRYTGSGYSQTTQLQPGDGYWLFANQDSEIKVNIQSLVSSSKTLARSAAGPVPDFAARISASVGNTIDEDNEFGLISDASPEWDKHDLREPPVIGEYIQLAFDNRSWAESGDLYSRDIRPTGELVYEWPLAVKTNKYGVVHLDFEWVTAIDPAWQVYLVDRDMGLVHNVSEDQTYSYTSTGTERNRIFMIVAGEAAHVDGQLEKYEIIPETYALGQNVPNPFNPVTSIPIVLGEDAFVTLSIFNVRGEEVSRILDHQSMSKGHHNTIWVGADQRGIKVPTGVYLYRIEVVDAFNNMLYQNTRKMILVK